MLLVRPALEYCRLVWNPGSSSDINRLEPIQILAARLMINSRRRGQEPTSRLGMVEPGIQNEEEEPSQLLQLIVDCFCDTGGTSPDDETCRPNPTRKFQIDQTDASSSPWTLDGQKYRVYINWSSTRPNRWAVSLYDQPFSIYYLVFTSPLTTMLTCAYTMWDNGYPLPLPSQVKLKTNYQTRNIVSCPSREELSTMATIIWNLFFFCEEVEFPNQRKQNGGITESGNHLELSH